MPDFIHDDEINGLELQPLAQIATHDGWIVYSITWHAPSDRVYFYQYFKESNVYYWHSQQNDTIKASLNRFGMLTNATVQMASILYAGGAHPAPLDFMTKNWSEYIASNEILSIDIVRDPTGDAPLVAVEYVSPEDLFGQ